MRYISTDEVKNHLEFDEINESDDPKLSVVERWINGSEAEVDSLTHQRWDLHTIENELISPDHQSQDFILGVRPLVRISKLEYQNGDQWGESWIEIESSNYLITKANISKIRTKDFYFAENALRVTYEAGYADIPVWLKELTLLLTEKRYVMSRLGIAAADSESVSVAVIRITDKSDASLTYRIKGLQIEIDDRLRLLGKRMKAKNYSMGFMNVSTSPSSRLRLY